MCAAWFWLQGRACSISRGRHPAGITDLALTCRDKEAIRQQAEAEAHARDLEADRQRREAYNAAVLREHTRVDTILAKNDYKMRSLEVTYQEREHENMRTALARQLDLNLRRQKVCCSSQSKAIRVLMNELQPRDVVLPAMA